MTSFSLDQLDPKELLNDMLDKLPGADTDLSKTTLGQNNDPNIPPNSMLLGEPPAELQNQQSGIMNGLSDPPQNPSPQQSSPQPSTADSILDAIRAFTNPQEEQEKQTPPLSQEKVIELATAILSMRATIEITSHDSGIQETIDLLLKNDVHRQQVEKFLETLHRGTEQPESQVELFLATVEKLHARGSRALRVANVNRVINLGSVVEVSRKIDPALKEKFLDTQARMRYEVEMGMPPGIYAIEQKLFGIEINTETRNAEIILVELYRKMNEMKNDPNVTPEQKAYVQDLHKGLEAAFYIESELLDPKGAIYDLVASYGSYSDRAMGIMRATLIQRGCEEELACIGYALEQDGKHVPHVLKLFGAQDETMHPNIKKALSEQKKVFDSRTKLYEKWAADLAKQDKE